MQPGPDQVAIVSMDGEPKHLVLPNTTRAFWKVVTTVDVEMIDTAENMRIDKRHLNKLDARARRPGRHLDGGRGRTRPACSMSTASSSSA